MIKKVVVLFFSLVAVSILLTSQTVFAGFSEDVINKYEDARGEDGVEHLEDYMERIGLDEYDYGSNSIDCSWYDVSCHVSGNFIFTNMVGLVKAGTEQINSIFERFTTLDITGDANNLWYMEGFKTLAWTMASLFLLYHAMKVTIMYIGQSDDGMNVLQEKLWKVLAIGILLGIYTELYKWIMQLLMYMNEEIIDTTLNPKEIVISLVVNGMWYGIILVLFLAVILIVFAIAYLYRFALFSLLFITGVIAIPTMLNDTFNFFNTWLKLVVSNFITLTLQTLCFALGFNKLVSLEPGSMLYGIAFFILALTVPGLLNQFGSSSGAGKAVSSGAKTIVRYASK
ncbi:hypothetical protein LG329_19510 (plasmid) [Virgibacillus necropolis]|uniref:conjugal transfer protein TrbL family protein n=1 Tax=Virgibacillus necropolis TaxID=163877 RepID=UPI00384FEE92